MSLQELWLQQEYGQRPVVLMVGWRRSRNRLAAGRLPVDGQAEEELRQSALSQIGRLDDMVPVNPSGAPFAEPGEEYFYLSTSGLPTADPELATSDSPEAGSTYDAQGSDDQDDQSSVSELLKVIEDAGEAEELTVGQVQEGIFLFFAVILQSTDPSAELVAVVRLWNPRRGIKPGRIITHYVNRVVHLETPVLIFDPDYDLIVRGTDIAYFAQTAFDRLFKDLPTIERRLPVHIEALAERVPLNAKSRQALQEACTRRISYAKRLERLVIGDQIPEFTTDELGGKLEEFGFEPDDFVTGGELDFSPDGAGIVLDYLEELYFRTMFTGEPRRADRHRDL